MTMYTWTGINRLGQKRKGEMDAPSPEAVEKKLRSQGINPKKVKKKPKDIVLTMPGSSGVTPKELMVFVRQFSAMIDAGLPLVQALDILAPQQENLVFREVISALRDDVSTGKTFAEALARHPKVFNPLFINLCAAGETGGILDTILQRLANQIEKSVKLAKQIKGALVYPVSVLVIALVCVAVLLIFVIPVFEEMFQGFGAELPAFTQMIIDLSDATIENWYFLFIIPISLIVIWKQIRGHPKGKYITDGIFLKLPIFGPLIQKASVASFTRTMSTMIASGVPIMDALEIVSRANSNAVISEAILYVRLKVGEGRPMAEPLEDTGIFPNMVTQMVSIGESTGAMDAMLGKIADFYEEEVDAAVAGLTSLLEPLIMVFLAGIVGSFLIAMYLPIFSIAGSIG